MQRAAGQMFLCRETCPLWLYRASRKKARIFVKRFDLYAGAIEITPIPTVEEFNTHVWGDEFHACIIEKAEFEAIWESRTYDGALKESGGF